MCDLKLTFETMLRSLGKYNGCLDILCFYLYSTCIQSSCRSKILPDLSQQITKTTESPGLL